MTRTKKDLALEFISMVRGMQPKDLHALIAQEAGEELAKFFLAYSAQLISQEPQKVLEHTSSLMLMGYLIRQNEENQFPRGQNIQGLGLA